MKHTIELHNAENEGKKIFLLTQKLLSFGEYEWEAFPKAKTLVHVGGDTVLIEESVDEIDKLVSSALDRS